MTASNVLKHGCSALLVVCNGRFGPQWDTAHVLEIKTLFYILLTHNFYDLIQIKLQVLIKVLIYYMLITDVSISARFLKSVY